METVVTNGCNGACCEAVFFPYTVEQLRLMGAAYKDGKEMWIDIDGAERKIKHDEIATHDEIADMLIPLGWWAVDPETRKPWKQKWEGWSQSEAQMVDYVHGSPAFRFNEGHVEGYVVTCRHFDTVKRICNNYENRPGLCRRYGCDDKVCEYKGCKITAIVNQLNEVQ